MNMHEATMFLCHWVASPTPNSISISGSARAIAMTSVDPAATPRPQVSVASHWYLPLPSTASSCAE